MRTDEREEEHVLRVKLDAGDEVVDPRADVERIEG